MSTRVQVPFTIPFTGTLNKATLDYINDIKAKNSGNAGLRKELDTILKAFLLASSKTFKSKQFFPRVPYVRSMLIA